LCYSFSGDQGVTAQIFNGVFLGILIWHRLMI
jgi:hypothetical protein